MSWSVSAVGKSQAVRKSIADQFARGGKCVEPEESVRQAAATILDAALAAQSEDTIVNTTASGSQSFKDYAKQEGPSNNLSISVQPMYGFLVE